MLLGVDRRTSLTGVIDQAPFPSLYQSHATFVSSVLPALSAVLFTLACFPMPKEVLLGMSGQWIYAMLAPLCMWIATGFVGFVILALEILLWIFRLIARIR